MQYKKDVLICDDDMAILDVVATVLHLHDINTRVRPHSGNIVSEIWKECPRILIIDLWMPELSGEDIIATLKANNAYDKLFILCISASIDGKEVAMRAGADMFLEKPFNLIDLIDIVDNVMSA